METCLAKAVRSPGLLEGYDSVKTQYLLDGFSQGFMLAFVLGVVIYGIPTWAAHAAPRWKHGKINLFNSTGVTESYIAKRREFGRWPRAILCIRLRTFSRGKAQSTECTAQQLGDCRCSSIADVRVYSI